ncbi:hypothetical protein FEM48_Zijuj10G0043200 [Ziziphus jujuba var. spinosa]|uniref:Cytochrome P450 71A1-like n=1 Tax=Ziziphus jujuba var. spinosa TaxID=714518 RepID=A0A978UL93_ZIZJJ|nr:hypothetical protein FEM48_Zijuj10G0043200 [Ziziphus jujuba var. spinosa]
MEDLVDVLLRVQQQNDLVVPITDDNLKAPLLAMRLHPPGPLLVPPESMQKCTLDGYEIASKTQVLINAYAIGRDPEAWENPLMYNPERRGCPGFAFGLAIVEIALARLLYHFDWALPQGVGPEDVDMEESFGLATRKKSALVLVPTPNKDYQLKDIDTKAQ